MNMFSRTTLIWSIVIALLFGGVVGYLSANNGDPQGNVDKQVALYSDMRKLWTDHATWTREYMVNSVNGSASVTPSANRLMKNQEEIGRAMGDYYGRDAGKELTRLLKEHISIAAEVVNATKENDQVKLDSVNARWQTNANEISKFLSAANPDNWPEGTLSDMMGTYLTKTADELDAIVKKQYDKSVTAFDNILDHMMEMSDTLSLGIIKQFPEKF
jgi:hypothetical protein